MEPSVTLTHKEINERLKTEVIKDIVCCTKGMSRTDELLHISYAMAYLIADNCDDIKAAQLTLDGLVDWIKIIIDNEARPGNKNVQ